MALQRPVLAGSGLGQVSVPVLHPAMRVPPVTYRALQKDLMNTSVHEISDQKPVATGNGLSASIHLAERHVFLTGFEHDGHSRQDSHNSSALLRGKLQLEVTKNVKIRAITLKLTGRARTEWPEGIPPQKVEVYEEDSLRTQTLSFFHAMHAGWETPYGNSCTFQIRNSNNSVNAVTLQRMGLESNGSSSSLHMGGRSRQNMSSKELKRLSLQSVQSRSFGKGDSPGANVVQAKGFKIFSPGTYEYSFELPIDHHQLETIKLQYGSVKWELETSVERAGAFKPNLHGNKEVSVVRVPDQLSLETTEPISISRHWEDQLHYDIMISGKSFPIGGQIPIAFKLTPLAKVQIHKLKVFVTESIEYWTNGKRVTRKDPGRKILLMEKAAGKPLDPKYEGCDLRIVSGGELSNQERSQARSIATRRRTNEAQRRGTTAQPLPAPTENLLGDLDLGLEHYWGSTEMEMTVQVPTCSMMARDKSLTLHPDCSWKNVNVFHWIKIVMRISRLDPDDPTGKRRRHFEISIDSPFTVLNCRATQANTALPQYTMPESSDRRTQAACGCHDARTTDTSPVSSTSDLSRTGRISPINTALPMPPQAAHLHTASGGTSTPLSTQHQQQGISVTSNSRPASMISLSGGAGLNPLQHHQGGQDTLSSSSSASLAPRPIHLLRYPSYDPPAFSDDAPPPALPMPTPPPGYDVIVGTPSVDGMADYFARLAEHDHPEEADAGVVPDMSMPMLTPQPLPLQVPVILGAGTAQAAAVAAPAYFSTSSSNDNNNNSQPSSYVQIEHEEDSTGEDTETETETEEEGEGTGSDTDDESHVPARVVSRGGAVNIPNPRTPGGRRGQASRSFDLRRPDMGEFVLSMEGVSRRG